MNVGDKVEVRVREAMSRAKQWQRGEVVELKPEIGAARVRWGERDEVWTFDTHDVRPLEVDPEVQSLAHLESMLAEVTVAGAMVGGGWQWETWVTDGGCYGVRASFLRPDRDSAEVGRGFSRVELVDERATFSAVVRTCFVLARSVVEHELLEAFKVRGVRLFDPHLTVEQLLGGRVAS
jgi:hypothetical protein